MLHTAIKTTTFRYKIRINIHRSIQQLQENNLELGQLRFVDLELKVFPKSRFDSGLNELKSSPIPSLQIESVMRVVETARVTTV